MIVDFQHHFTPRELMPKDLGRRKVVSYDEHGAPSFILHWMLFDLDEHIRMMDEAGIDVAFLTSAAGMCADLDKSRLCNESAKKAERDYPGRFIGAAHANPLGGADALRELNRCKHELGFPGVVITSETNGLYLDAAEFEPFWTECARLGLFVFVHPHYGIGHSLFPDTGHALLLALGAMEPFAALRRGALEAGRAWLAARRARRLGQPPPAPWIPAWPVRLLQIQLCVIYLTTGLAKLLGQVVQSWQLLVGCGSCVRWSWYRCGKRLQQWWSAVVVLLGQGEALGRWLVAMASAWG